MNKFTKIKIIFIGILFFGVFGLAKSSRAATYYVNSTLGNDGWEGNLVNGDFLPEGCEEDEDTADCFNGPWKSLSNISGKNIFNPGDTFLFKRGGVWSGNIDLKIESTGTAESPITFGSYGSGSLPKLRHTGSDYYPFSIGGGHSYITIADIEFIRATESDGYVLYIGGDHAILRNCVLYFESGFSPQANDCVKTTETADYASVVNNTIFGAPNQGVDAVAADNLIIKKNIIHDCQNAIVIKGGTKNSIIESNLVYNFTYGAIGLGGTTDPQWKDEDHEVIDCIARYNVVYDTRASGSGGGIFLWGAKGSRVYNNTIHGNSIAVQTGGNPENPGDYCSDTIIRNNIIWRTSSSGIFIVDSGNESGLLMSNNIYYKTTGSGEFKISGAWKTYSQWMSEYNYDSNSQYANPEFMDSESCDFYLQASSPAIDAGTDVGLASDFDGHPIVGAPDIGAYEYQIKNTPPAAPEGLYIR